MIELTWQVAATLLVAFFGGLFAFGKLLLVQFEKRMDERKDENRRAIERLENSLAAEREQIRVLQEEVRSAVNSLPLQYVRREDWIRFSATIDHKLDRLAELMMRQGVGDAQR